MKEAGKPVKTVLNKSLNCTGPAHRLTEVHVNPKVNFL